MKQDARYALILESIAEMNAQLRILDEANARLEAAVKRQLELLEILVTRQEQILSVPLIEHPGWQMQETQQHPAGNGSAANGSSRKEGALARRIIDHDRESATDTHPALFRVVDLLEQDERARELSVRQLAQETGVSKSWCSIAKRHVLSEERVH